MVLCPRSNCFESIFSRCLVIRSISLCLTPLLSFVLLFGWTRSNIFAKKAHWSTFCGITCKTLFHLFVNYISIFTVIQISTTNIYSKLMIRHSFESAICNSFTKINLIQKNRILGGGLWRKHQDKHCLKANSCFKMKLKYTIFNKHFFAAVAPFCWPPSYITPGRVLDAIVQLLFIFILCPEIELNSKQKLKKQKRTELRKLSTTTTKKNERRLHWEKPLSGKAYEICWVFGFVQFLLATAWCVELMTTICSIRQSKFVVELCCNAEHRSLSED